MINFKKTYIMKTGIIVKDPGDDGMENVGGSDVNHMASALVKFQNSFNSEVSISFADQHQLLIFRVALLGSTDQFLCHKVRHSQHSKDYKYTLRYLY